MKTERIKREIEDLRYYGGLLTIAAANVFKLANYIENDVEDGYNDPDGAKERILDRIEHYKEHDRPRDLQEWFLDDVLSALEKLCDKEKE